MAVEWKKLAFENDVITKATLTAKGGVISASAASTPGMLAVGNNGDVLTADSGESLGIKWAAPGTPGAHASTHKNAGSDEILLHEFGEPTSAVNINGQQLTDAVLHTAAENPAAAVVAKIYYKTGDGAYVCTSAT